ncbi:MAG: hypothetical protein WC588_00230 [Candidatus Micrarchaeia archaeon]
MSYCSICHAGISPRVAAYSKQNFGEYLCMSCQNNVRATINQPGAATIKTQMPETQIEIEDDEGGEFPSHSEFYRDFHIIADYLVEAIYDMGNFKYQEEKRSLLGGKKIMETKFEFDIEVGGWDAIIRITDTPEKKFQPIVENGEELCTVFCIKYKSSIEEWSRNFGTFVRQMKTKSVPSTGIKFLVSFDDRCGDYFEAGKAAGFFIVALPRDLITELKANR